MIIHNGIPYELNPETGETWQVVDSTSDGSADEVEEELEEEILSSARGIIEAEVYQTYSFTSLPDYEPCSQGHQPSHGSSTTTAPQVHDTATNGTPSLMPGTFALDDPTASGQPSRDTSRVPQERSLVLYRSQHQSPSSASIDFPAGPRDPARQDTRPPSPAIIGHTNEIGGESDRGSVTPRAGHMTLGSLSRGDSQSPIPPRRNRGKTPMFQQYSDEEGLDEDKDANMGDLGPDPNPRRRPDQVFSVFICSSD